MMLTADTLGEAFTRRRGGGWVGDGLCDVTVRGGVIAEPVELRDPANVTFDGVRFAGTAGRYALSVLQGAGVKLRRCVFDGGRGGVAAQGVERLTDDGSTYARMTANGMMIGACRKVRLYNQRFHSFAPDEGEHPDAIQFRTPGSAAEVCRDIVVRGATMMGPMQGVFCRPHETFGGVDGIAVEGLVACLGHANAIGLRLSRRVTIEDADVSTWPGSRDWARINVADVADVTFLGRSVVQGHARWAAQVFAAE